jgi:hypothetical protein
LTEFALGWGGPGFKPGTAALPWGCATTVPRLLLILFFSVFLSLLQLCGLSYVKFYPTSLFIDALVALCGSLFFKDFLALNLAGNFTTHFSVPNGNATPQQQQKAGNRVSMGAPINRGGGVAGLLV